MFNAQMGRKKILERRYFRSGQHPVMTKVGPFKAGMTVCYDLRFPWLFQTYGHAGCQVIFVPAAFTRRTGQAHWEVLLRARAIENLCYIVAPNQPGVDRRGLETYGSSLIISPWGEVLARGSQEREEVLYADLRMNALRKARAILPAIFQSHTSAAAARPFKKKGVDRGKKG